MPKIASARSHIDHHEHMAPDVSPPKDVLALARIGLAVVEADDATVERVARAIEDADETPYVVRYNKKYDDGRLWEVVRMDNDDWQDVVSDEMTVMGRFARGDEAQELFDKLIGEYRARAALQALADGGRE